MKTTSPAVQPTTGTPSGTPPTLPESLIDTPAGQTIAGTSLFEPENENARDDKAYTQKSESVGEKCCGESVEWRRHAIALEILKVLIPTVAGKLAADFPWIVAGDVIPSYVRQAYKYADELLAQESKK